LNTTRSQSIAFHCELADLLVQLAHLLRATAVAHTGAEDLCRATAGSVSPCWLVTGGTIAFEIARQLLAADAEVEFLGMIDPMRIIVVCSNQKALARWSSIRPQNSIVSTLC
jgi:hypothetical protein